MSDNVTPENIFKFILSIPDLIDSLLDEFPIIAVIVDTVSFAVDILFLVLFILYVRRARIIITGLRKSLVNVTLPHKSGITGLKAGKICDILFTHDGVTIRKGAKKLFYAPIKDITGIQLIGGSDPDLVIAVTKDGKTDMISFKAAYDYANAQAFSNIFSDYLDENPHDLTK